MTSYKEDFWNNIENVENHFDPCTDLPEEKMKLQLYSEPVEEPEVPEDPLDQVVTRRELEAKISQAKLEAINAAHPVGSVFMTFDGTDPTETIGGKWIRVAQGRTLLGASDEYQVGSEGGVKEVTLNINQIPQHNHGTSTTSWVGNHNHTRGSMNITGTIDGNVNDGEPGTGAFYKVNESRQGSDGDKGGGVIGFDASRTWSGRTSDAGGHNHTVGTNNTGGNQPHTNMMPYLVVNLWQRIE